jgi:hypothetical protein
MIASVAIRDAATIPATQISRVSSISRVAMSHARSMSRGGSR